MADIVLQELGEGIEKATIACWHKNVGEEVAADEDVVEVVTDKASFNIPSIDKGTIREIKFKEGEEAKVGDTLAVIT